MTFGPKRLHQTAHVRRRALGSKDGDAEVGCQIRDAHAVNCPGFIAGHLVATREADGVLAFTVQERD